MLNCWNTQGIPWPSSTLFLRHRLPHLRVIPSEIKSVNAQTDPNSFFRCLDLSILAFECIAICRFDLLLESSAVFEHAPLLFTQPSPTNGPTWAEQIKL